MLTPKYAFLAGSIVAVAIGIILSKAKHDGLLSSLSEVLHLNSGKSLERKPQEGILVILFPSDLHSVVAETTNKFKIDTRFVNGGWLKAIQRKIFGILWIAEYTIG